jgi:hypothetical protein
MVVSKRNSVVLYGCGCLLEVFLVQYGCGPISVSAKGMFKSSMVMGKRLTVVQYGCLCPKCMVINERLASVLFSVCERLVLIQYGCERLALFQYGCEKKAYCSPIWL